jgi:hypothetical protein
MTTQMTTSYDTTRRQHQILKHKMATQKRQPRWHSRYHHRWQHQMTTPDDNTRWQHQMTTLKISHLTPWQRQLTGLVIHLSCHLGCLSSGLSSGVVVWCFHLVLSSGLLSMLSSGLSSNILICKVFCDVIWDINLGCHLSLSSGFSFWLSSGLSSVVFCVVIWNCSGLSYCIVI